MYIQPFITQSLLKKYFNKYYYNYNIDPPTTTTKNLPLSISIIKQNYIYEIPSTTQPPPRNNIKKNCTTECGNCV